MLSGAAAGAAGLSVGASVSIAVAEPQPATLTYEDVAAVLQGLGCWQLGGYHIISEGVGFTPPGASGTLPLGHC